MAGVRLRNRLRAGRQRVAVYEGVAQSVFSLAARRSDVRLWRGGLPPRRWTKNVLDETAGRVLTYGDLIVESDRGRM
jgi:hypothetical protein